MEWFPPWKWSEVKMNMKMTEKTERKKNIIMMIERTQHTNVMAWRSIRSDWTGRLEGHTYYE